MTRVDPITRQVIRNALRAAAGEMQASLVKTAHNPLLYEVQDFGMVLTNRFGELIAEGSGLPGFLACLPPTIKSGRSVIGAENFRDGDVVLTNEPDDTGTHISDTVLYTPVFYRGELVAFAAVMAHWADIGGITPSGWCPYSTSLHQEGMIFSHNKLFDGGDLNRELLRFILRNVRFPGLVEGDLNAKIACCRTGAARYLALCERYGAELVEEAMLEAFALAERRMRAEIRAIPDGTYRAEGALDHDGVVLERPRSVAVAVTVEGEELTVDWNGTSEVAKGPVNHPLVGTAALCATVLKSLTTPDDATNEGHLRPLVVKAPPDTLVSARYPAPCDSYGYAAELIIHLVIKALAQAVPERCPAATYQMAAFNLVRDDPRFGRPFIYGEPLDGGGGAFPHDDGPSGIMFLGNGDAPNTPVEIVEARYPVLVTRYTFNPEHRGVGRFRGGYGVIRDYRILEDHIYLQTSTENNRHPMWGLEGGGDAGETVVVINEGTPRQVTLDDRVTDFGPFGPGDTISFRTANGGGWGSPEDRDIAKIAQDVRNGLLTVEAAHRLYRVDRGELERELERLRGPGRKEFS